MLSPGIPDNVSGFPGVGRGDPGDFRDMFPNLDSVLRGLLEVGVLKVKEEGLLKNHLK